MANQDEFATKADLKELKEEIIHEFHLFLDRVSHVLSLNNISPKRENA